MMKQSKDLALYAFSKKTIPNGKQNFTFKEVKSEGMLKRLFYVGNCADEMLYNITVLDASKDGTTQILQAREGSTETDGWRFKKGAIYT